MASDLLVSITDNSETAEWNIEVARQGRRVHLSIAQEAQDFYPLLRLEAGPSTPLRKNWMQ
jgi:hypothetical protein